STVIPTSWSPPHGPTRSTTFPYAALFRASIQASDIASAGSAAVTVFNPSPGGGTSNSVTFTIGAANPVPSITSINPTSATAGGTGVTVTVSGSNIISTSVLRWNGSNRSTT